MRNKKFMTKLCAFLSVAVLSAGLALPIAGCSEDSVESVEIELVDQTFRPRAVVNEECDVLDAVENYDPSLTYEITELYYLDEDFERQNIPYSGTKFTLTTAREVYVTLVAKKDGKQVGEEEFTLDYEIRATELAEAYLTTWVDPGVTKTLVADAEYLTEGSTWGIKVSYNGAYNPVNDGVAIGSPDTTLGSNTSWDNVVLTADIYNPQDYEIDIAIMFSKSNSMWTNGQFESTRFMSPFTLTPNAWTQVAWSFRSIGIMEDVFESGVGLGIKLRIKDTAAANLVAPYSYSLIFNNFDYVDYTADQFPNLDTRTQQEIFEQSPGELTEKYLITHAVEQGSLVNANYAKTEIKKAVKEYTNDGLAKPEGLSTTSYMEYNVTATGAIGNYYSVPFRFSTSGAQRPINDTVKNSFTVTDWSNAYVGFWVYNDTDIPLTFVGTKAADRNYWGGAQKTVAENKKWQYIEFSLKDEYGFTENIFAAENYNLNIFARYSGTGYSTADTYQNFAGKFYVDGFDIYNKAAAPMSEMLLSHYVAQSSLVNANYAKTTVTASEKAYSATVAKPTDLSDDSTKYVEYNVKATGAIGNYYFVPFNFSNVGGATAPVSDSFKEAISVTDWSNAYVGFWVYNDTDIPLTFVGTKAADRNYWGGAQKTVAENKKWQYIEFSLKDDYGFTTNIFAEESYHFKIFGRYSGTDYSTADTYQNFAGKLYITGFDIYNK